ncbi:uncharacterized protein LOC118437017 [Folsomia candida]|uniref:RING-type E3 ubiquitin transferase n=1 Tax=Folsomia candida TaxID=158441 RepID=A0A226DVY9_FOLCA|nr:uncharacterized protein LOC118437017 [Folsomia candida]OXA48974.1 E3 ubiquitin-protein ligase sina [Folsomia candida]
MGNVLSSNIQNGVPYPSPSSLNSSPERPHDPCDIFCECENCDTVYNNASLTSTTQPRGFNDYPSSTTPYSGRVPPPPAANSTSRDAISTNYGGQPIQPLSTVPTREFVSLARSRQELTRVDPPRTQITGRSQVASSSPTQLISASSQETSRITAASSTSRIRTAPSRARITIAQSTSTMTIAPTTPTIIAPLPLIRTAPSRPTITTAQSTSRITIAQRTSIMPTAPSATSLRSTRTLSTIRSPDRLTEVNRTSLPSTSRSRPPLPISWDLLPTPPSNVYRILERPMSSSASKSTEVSSSTSRETWPSYLFEDSVDEVSNMLECSICLDLCAGRITQCKNGHNICATHIPQISTCPICRASYDAGCSRNLLAEKLIVQERKKIEMKEEQKKLLDNMEKLKIRKIKCIPKPKEVDKPCRYAADGCAYQGGTTRLQEHQLICHFQPIECCFKTDGCQNSSIQFSDYILHLRNVHSVKTFSNEAYVKFYVNRGRKWVRDGSSSMAIIQGPLGTENFVLRAIQSDDDVIIWVAIHENPQRAYRLRTELKLDDKNYARFGIDGLVQNTTRDRSPAMYLTIPVKHLKTNLRQETNRGNYVREYWAVTVKIIG